MCDQNISTLGADYKATQDRKAQVRTEKQRRKDNDRTVQQTIGLKRLAKAIHGRDYIPYEKLLSPDGFMTDSMSVRISKRKREIDAEMAQIQAIDTKFNISF